MDRSLELPEVSCGQNEGLTDRTAEIHIVGRYIELRA